MIFTEYSSLLQKQHKLKNKVISIEVIKNTNPVPVVMIRVTGFSSEISQDMLEIYFESKKSGSKEGALISCVIVEEGIAHLKFNDSEG